jgi:hypothetical protein
MRALSIVRRSWFYIQAKVSTIGNYLAFCQLVTKKYHQRWHIKIFGTWLAVYELFHLTLKGPVIIYGKGGGRRENGVVTEK